MGRNTLGKLVDEYEHLGVMISFLTSGYSEASANRKKRLVEALTIMTNLVNELKEPKQ